MATEMKRVSSKPLMCNEGKQELADEVSAAIWLPLTLVTVYVAFLRFWYFTFLAEGQGNSSVFSEVWLACPAAFSVAYLILIKAIMHVMKDREPLALKNYMLTYNLYQTILNAWGVAAIIKEVYLQNMSIWGNVYAHSDRSFNMGFLIWVHYNNKYVELLDTVFMALRKKNRQISFLHVYHHVLLIWSWYAVCRIMPGGDAYFGALCNSFVHVLMYAYYGAALMKVQMPWKRQLTNIQMLQFCACFAQSSYAIYKGNVPKFLAYLQMWVMTNMLVLFGNFIYQNYFKKKSAKKTA